MPAASSSRRRRNREPSEDRIENEDFTQRGRENDDVDEEDEQPRRKSTKEKKLSVKKSKARNEPQGDDDEGEGKQQEDDDDRIDVNDFKDQPLDRKDAPKISGIAQDWKAIRENVHTSSFQLVTDIAASLAEVEGESQEDKKTSKELDRIMKELIDIEDEMLSHEKMVSDLQQLVAQGESIDDAVERYEKGVKVRLNSYRNKTTRQKYGKHAKYTDFQQRIHEAKGQTMPPLADLLPKEDGDLSDDDEDIEVGGVTQDFKCPLTMTVLDNPMTSSVCGHSFSATAIRDYLGTSRVTKKKCPASGCNKWFSQSDLKSNKDLEKRVKAAARRLRAQEEDDDDDDDDMVVD